MKNIKEYCAEKKEELKNYIRDNDLQIRTVIIQVGDNQASNAYIKGKIKDCREVGIDCGLIHFDEDITEGALIQVIKDLNTEFGVDGYIVQLPLPPHISEAKITAAIDYHKDIDGFTKNALVNPATPQGILTYLEDNNFNFVDANAVVIGRSNIVGRPMARLLLDKSCNVTVLHSKTSAVKKAHYLSKADLVVVAAGHRNTLVDGDFHIYNGYTRDPNFNCFVVDVGINRNEEGKLCGDCESLTICEKTPVPGGVGLLTRLALISNIVKLYEINHANFDRKAEWLNK